MTKHLVETAVYWLNSFPSENGISNTLSPGNIVLGRANADFSKPKVAFGTYALVYTGTTNTMKSRSVPSIALGPSNEWGGHYFMSLYTGKRLHSYHWKSLPMDQEAIDRVTTLATAENQPALIDGMPIFEWNIGIPIDDTEDTTNDSESITDEYNDMEPLQLQHDEPHLDHDEDAGAYITEADSSSHDEDDDVSLSTASDIIPLVDPVINPQDVEQPANDLYPAFIEDSDSQDRFAIEEKQLLDELEVFGVNIANAPCLPSSPNITENVDITSDTSSITSQNDDTPPDIPDPINDLGTSLGENQGVGDTLPSGRPKRAAVNKGITRLQMDPKGKTYKEYQQKQFLITSRKRRQSHKRKQKKYVQLFMQKQKTFKHTSDVYMQRAVDVIFTQMSAKKGLKKFGEKAVAAMIKEFRQLDEGAFPGKPVVGPANPDSLTSLERQAALEAVNLIKKKKGMEESKAGHAPTEANNASTSRRRTT